MGGLEGVSAPAPAPESASAAPIPVIEDAERLEKLSEPALVHRNFDIVYANPAMRALFGQSTSQTAIADNNLLNLFPDERARLFSLQAKFDDGKAPAQAELLDVKLRARTPDRRTITIVTSLDRKSVV